MTNDYVTDINVGKIESDDLISRKSIKQKLQENYDFFVNAYGGFGNLPQSDKSRVDEISNCIAMIVNEPPATPKVEQKAVLDKIRAEIEQLTSRYSISKERDGMGIVEWSDRLIEESNVLQIIDKYKAESEDKK